MTEDKLNQLFQELKFERIETSPVQIDQWIESNRISKRKGTQGLLRILLVIVPLSVFLIYFGNLAPVHSTIAKSIPLHHFDFDQLSTPKLEINYYSKHRSTTYDLNKYMYSLPILEEKMTETIQIDKLPLLKLKKEFPCPLSEARNEKPKRWFSSLVLAQPKNGAVMDTTLKFFNELVILDSIKSYRSIRQFLIDDRTSYLFIYDDYVVISYRYRGANFFRSGKVYESGELMVDGEKTQILGFMCDNRYTTAHFGQRFYLGIQTNEDDSKKIIFFNYLWAPSTIIKGHNASVVEKDNLIQLSNSKK